MIKQFVIGAVLVICICSFASASFLADRPLSSDDTSTPGKNEIEIISGMDKPDSAADTTNYNSIFAYGIMDNLDIELAIPYTFKSAINGIGDISLGSQVRVVEESFSLPSLAFAIAAKLATANKESGLGTGSNSYMLEIIGTKLIGDLSIIGNLSYNHAPSDPIINNLTTSLAAAYSFSNRILLVGESIYNLIPSQTTSELNILAGLIYSMNKNINLDFGIGKNLSQNNPISRITAGIAINYFLM